MIVAHHVADDLRALPMFGVSGEVLLPHRVEDAALDRLETIADVGKRTRGDDRERVIEVASLGRLVQLHHLGIGRSSRPSCIDYSAAAVAVEQ